MEYKKSILLYSEYSPNSSKLINFIKENNIELNNLYYLCIDDDKIRDLILKNKQFEIKIVPCLLLFYENGIIEKYDDIQQLFTLLFQEKDSDPNINLNIPQVNELKDDLNIPQVNELKDDLKDDLNIPQVNELKDLDDIEKDEDIIIDRKNKKNNDNDPHGTIALAKQLAQGREDFDSMINKKHNST